MTVSPAFVTETTQVAARTAIAAALVAAVALVLLHIMRRDLDPGWHVISEYAVGARGWIMGLCFAAFAVAPLLGYGPGAAPGATARGRRAD